MKSFNINCAWCLKKMATTTSEEQSKVERMHIECAKVAVKFADAEAAAEKHAEAGYEQEMDRWAQEQKMIDEQMRGW